MDSRCDSGYRVSPYYDSLPANLITQGDSREEAIRKMDEALEGFVVRGIDTTIPFHRFILGRDEYRSRAVNTRLIEETVMKEFAASAAPEPGTR